MTQSIQLHYRRLGNGPETLLAFHGIGQTGAACYTSFAEELGDRYSIIAFDLPFHGETKGHNRSGDFPMTPAHWKDFLDDFLTNTGIDRFSIAGFSLGGRFALVTFQLFPERINTMYLMAPDGIRIHPLYRLTTQTAAGRRLLHWSLQRPGCLFKIAGWGQQAGVLAPSVVRVVRHLLETPEKAQQVYASWVNFRLMKPDRSALATAIETAPQKVWLLIGAYDRMIGEKTVKAVVKGLPQGNFQCLPYGHAGLVAGTARWIRQNKTAAGGN